MAVSDGNATAFAEPAALTSDWELRLGPPLFRPHQVYPGYLVGIFTGVLKNALPWAETWIGQIMGACAWLQVALLSGYQRTDAMRAMHRAMARAYAGSPHAHQAITKVLDHVSYRLPQKRCQVARQVQRWLRKHAYWS